MYNKLIICRVSISDNFFFIFYPTQVIKGNNFKNRFLHFLLNNILLDNKIKLWILIRTLKTTAYIIIIDYFTLKHSIKFEENQRIPK